MKRLITCLSLLLVVALALTEAHSVLYHLRPDIARQKTDMFWSGSYHRELTVQWYLKFTFDSFFRLVCCYCAAMVAIRYSFKLSLIFGMLTLYCYIDLFLFWYNYNSGVKMYWVMVGIVIGCFVLLLLPMKNEGKYKSLI